MSGRVVVEGGASQSAGATGRGGLLVIKGSAAARCGISMKGVEIVVHGSIGHVGGFMAQKGALVVCGDAGEGLGDSIYEAHVYVRGDVAELGADCVEKEMRSEHLEELERLLELGEADARAADFRRYGSARQLYSFRRRQRRRLLMTEFDALSKDPGPSTRSRYDRWRPGFRESVLFDRNVIHEIHRMAREGIYDIRGLRREAARASLRRPPLPRRERLPLSATRATARAAVRTSPSAVASQCGRSISRFRSRSPE